MKQPRNVFTKTPLTTLILLTTERIKDMSGHLKLPPCNTLPLILASILALTGCVSQSGPKGANPAGTTAGQNNHSGTTNQQGPDISLKVLGVVNAHVDSVTLGKKYRGYQFYIGTTVPSPTEQWDMNRTFYFSPTSTASIYIHDSSPQSTTTLTLYTHCNIDLSKVSISRDGKQPELLINERYEGYNLHALYEAPQTEIFQFTPESPKDTLLLNINNEIRPFFYLDEYYPRGFWQVQNTGARSVHYALWREVLATISIKDTNGNPITGLTKENFVISAGNSTLQARVSEVGQGTYRFSELAREQSAGQTININVTVVNGQGSGSATF